MTAPLAIALDAPDLDTAVGWAAAVAPHVEVLKVGLELWCRYGPAAAEAVLTAGARAADAAGAEAPRLFLDLKLHDIPATVAGAARSAALLAPRLLTVHASGGAAMVRAAAQAAPDVAVTAVTVLTSMREDDLAAVGLAGPAQDAVVRLALLSVVAGARALVCSPREVAAVRAAVGPGVLLVTPGVRPAGSGSDDQARVATPAQALADGADLLVVGRPVTAVADPGAAARAFAEELAR